MILFSKVGWCSFWDMLSKIECGDLGFFKIIDDIVLDWLEDIWGWRCYKIESVWIFGGVEWVLGLDFGV